MKTIEHKNMEIEDFQQFYSALHKQHPEILGAEWNKETNLLKVFYEDGTTEVQEDVLQNLKIPTVLRFRKKVTPPKLDSATAVSATENEIIVETFDTEAVRKEVKKNLAQFEEVT